MMACEVYTNADSSDNASSDFGPNFLQIRSRSSLRVCNIAIAREVDVFRAGPKPERQKSMPNDTESIRVSVQEHDQYPLRDPLNFGRLKNGR